MCKYGFKDVMRLEGQIRNEISKFKKSKINIPIQKTIIPNLFERMRNLDEPTWEKLVMEHKDLAR
jgi:hypothetical protein